MKLKSIGSLLVESNDASWIQKETWLPITNYQLSIQWKWYSQFPIPKLFKYLYFWTCFVEQNCFFGSDCCKKSHLHLMLFSFNIKLQSYNFNVKCWVWRLMNDDLVRNINSFGFLRLCYCKLFENNQMVKNDCVPFQFWYDFFSWRESFYLGHMYV